MIINTVNQKGGKKKTAQADAFVSQSQGVLLVDADPQEAMSIWCDVKKSARFRNHSIRDLVRSLSLQQTVKYWAVFIFIAAMSNIPAAVRSNQSQTLHYNQPIIVSGSLLSDLFPDFVVGHHLIESEASGEVDIEIEDPEPPFHDHIMRAAQTYQVDAALIRAIIMAESNYNPKAVSHRGAQGLMQLMPTTARWLGVHDPFDPALNIDAGVRYFKDLLDRFDGDVQLALAAYNAGCRYVRKYDGVPPFATTRAYIKKVLQYRRIFQAEMATGQRTLITG
jgi:hypothetical protein